MICRFLSQLKALFACVRPLRLLAPDPDSAEIYLETLAQDRLAPELIVLRNTWL